jgi:uncharacterized glyoxalase superfamily protein PhnB
MPSNTNFDQASNNRSMPDATVIPVLHYLDVPSAAAWLCRAFGFSERLRIGAHRIQLQIGEGAVVIAPCAESTEGAAAAVHSVMVRVLSVNSIFESAKAAGARISGEPVSFPYGERQFTAVDLGGHVWTFSQTVADIDPASWGGELVQGDAGEEKPVSGQNSKSLFQTCLHLLPDHQFIPR